MKVIAFQSNSIIILQATVEELGDITGHKGTDLDKAFGIRTYYGTEINEDKDKATAICVPNYPVSKTYREARETLLAYSELKTKFESIRNQLSTLLARMESIRGEK
jgi:hypothetical protein